MPKNIPPGIPIWDMKLNGNNHEARVTQEGENLYRVTLYIRKPTGDSAILKHENPINCTIWQLIDAFRSLGPTWAQELKQEGSRFMATRYATIPGTKSKLVWIVDHDNQEEAKVVINDELLLF